MFDSNLSVLQKYKGICFDPCGFNTTTVLTINQDLDRVFWFKGDGVLSEFNIETLNEKVLLLSYLQIYKKKITTSPNVRKIDVNKSCDTIICLEIDFHTINLFDLAQDKKRCSTFFELVNFENIKRKIVAFSALTKS